MVTLKRLKSLIHYNPKTGVFTWREDRYRKIKAGDRAGCKSHEYRQICIDYRLYREHRLAWFYMKGRWPRRQIDHRDLDGSNNKWENLRLATPAQNAQNCGLRSHNKSGYSGVAWRKEKKRWRARIHANGTDVFLGHFEKLEDAVTARLRAEKKYFKDFARERP